MIKKIITIFVLSLILQACSVGTFVKVEGKGGGTAPAAAIAGKAAPAHSDFCDAIGAKVQKRQFNRSSSSRTEGNNLFVLSECHD